MDGTSTDQRSFNHSGITSTMDSNTNAIQGDLFLQAHDLGNHGITETHRHMYLMQLLIFLVLPSSYLCLHDWLCRMSMMTSYISPDGGKLLWASEMEILTSHTGGAKGATVGCILRQARWRCTRPMPPSRLQGWLCWVFGGLMTSPESLVRPLLRCIVPCIGKTLRWRHCCRYSIPASCAFRVKGQEVLSFVWSLQCCSECVTQIYVGIWNANNTLRHPSANVFSCFFFGKTATTWGDHRVKKWFKQEYIGWEFKAF